MEQAKKLIELQEDRFEHTQKAKINYLKTSESRITTSYLETRLETLEKLYSSFTSIHEEILRLIPREQRRTVEYFTFDKFEQIEEFYTEYKACLKERLCEFNKKTKGNTLSPCGTSMNTEIKLPAIQIPTFSGNYTDWPSFRDLFTSIIHKNTTLDDVQKLHYLKSLVAGEAEQLLRSIQITNDNYTRAWETLFKRFDNKRYIANDIFRKLFSLKTISNESAHLLKQLLYTTLECLNSLKNIKIDTETWDDIFIYMTVSKLDPISHQLWEQHVSAQSNEMPSFQQLCLFLEMRFKSLEMVEDHSQSASEPKTFYSAVSTSSAQCTFCDGDHYIFQCKQFVRQSHEKRIEYVRENKLCFNCLIPNHSVNVCLRDTCCNICKRKHHSLLHPGRKMTPKEQWAGETQHKENESVATHFIQQPGQALLATAMVDVFEKSSDTYVYRALLDQGSQASFVTEDLVKTAGLKKYKINSEITGLSEGSKLRTNYVVEFKIRSRTNPRFTTPVKAYVLKKITNYLPSQSCDVIDWPEVHTIGLADPTFNVPRNIDILLGAEIYATIIEDGLLRNSAGTIAQKTKLGWILSGETKGTLPSRSGVSLVYKSPRNESKTSVGFNKTWWAVKNGVLGGRNVGAVSASQQ